MGWWVTAKPGDRVVCVGLGEDWSSNEWLIMQGMQLPKKNAVYSIRCIGPVLLDPKRFSLRLLEIVNPSLVVEGIDLGEVCWPAPAFRPAVNRATDISVFTALLSTAPSSLDMRGRISDLEGVGASVDPRVKPEDDAGKAGAA